MTQDIFTALAEPTRRSILELLAQDGQLSATDITRNFKTTPQAISQHLKVLRETHLVKVEKRAQQRLYEINKDTVREFEHWVEKLRQSWEEKFDRLDNLLKKELKKQ